MVTTNAKDASRPRWLELLDRVLEARKAGAIQNYLRVCLLVEIFDDAEYRDKLRYELGEQVIDDDVIAGTLDQYVADFGMPFIQLRTVREAFPTADEWASRPLWELFDEALARRRVAEPAEPRKPRRTATIAQVEALEQAVTESVTKAKQVPVLKKQVVDLSDELKTLRARVAELERENAELRKILSDAMVTMA
jgi:hypothetical protein